MCSTPSNPLPYPTVACVDGAALGGGLEVASSPATFAWRGTNAKTRFGMPEVSLGLIPGWGGTQRLPRIVGPTSALEDALAKLATRRGRRHRHRGLVSRIVPSENLRAEAAATLRESHLTGAWRRQRDVKRQPLEVAGSELTIEDMSAGKLSEPKLNAMSLSPEALKTFRDYACRQMKDNLTCPAASAAVDVVARGCLLPLPDALRLETDTFCLRLAGSPEGALHFGFLRESKTRLVTASVRRFQMRFRQEERQHNRQRENAAATDCRGHCYL